MPPHVWAGGGGNTSDFLSFPQKFNDFLEVFTNLNFKMVIAHLLLYLAIIDINIILRNHDYFINNFREKIYIYFLYTHTF